MTCTIAVRCATRPGHLSPSTDRVFERNLRADDEILHRRCDEDLAGTCQCGNPRAELHGDAGDVVVCQFDLTCVSPADGQGNESPA